MSLLSWLKKNTARDDAWITVHPNAGGKGSPVLLDDEGYIKGGMGGKFTGQRIDLIPRQNQGLKKELSGAENAKESTPGFLRTERYTLKAPENVASQATTTPQKNDNENKTPTAPESPSIPVIPSFSHSPGKLEMALNSAATSIIYSDLVSNEKVAEFKNDAIREYNDAVAVIEKGAKDGAISDPNRTLNECIYAIHDVMQYKMYEEAGKSNSVYKRFARKAESAAVVSQGKLDGMKAFVNGTLTTTPAILGGVKRGEPMPQKEADEGNANPKFLETAGNRTNCQTCVVAYEARLRGYNVIAGPERSNNVSGKIAGDTTAAWVDTRTGLPPTQHYPPAIVISGTGFYKYLQGALKTGERYNLGFNWLGRNYGHIVSMERTQSGEVKIFDPQTGGTYEGQRVIDEYLGKMSYGSGIASRRRPGFYRVDNLAFNEKACGKMLRKAAKK